MDSCAIFPAVHQDEPAHSIDSFVFDSNSGWHNYKGVRRLQLCGWKTAQRHGRCWLALRRFRGDVLLRWQ
eukprot:483108-Amphidinium_carterae.2